MSISLFKLSLKLQKIPIDHAIARVRDLQSSNDVLSRRAELVDHHIINNAFYAALVQGTKTWENLPILTKQHLQIPLVERLSKGFVKTQLYTNKTSGSTGDPMYFAKDKFAHAMHWAATAQMYADFGIDLYRDRQARFYGIPLSGKSRRKELIKDFLAHRKRFAIMEESPEALSKHLGKLMQYNPDYCYGYTSAVVAMVNFCVSEKIDFKAAFPRLKAIVVTSEMLEPDELEMIQYYAGVLVINEYGSSETGVIAMGVGLNGWKVNSINHYIEVVDDEGKILPDGEIGKILITDLNNRAMPLIRYEIGDTGSLETRNGERYISRLNGRTTDYALLPDGRKIPALAFYYVTKKVIEDNHELSSLTIEQTEVDRFIVQYVAPNELDREQKDLIIQAMHSYLRSEVSVDFKRAARPFKTAAGKRRQFINSIHDNN